jgi:hypothetical protein
MLTEREAWWAPIQAQREQERLDGIAAAAGAIHTYLPDWQGKQTQADAARQQRLAASRKALADFASTTPALQAAWETSLTAAARQTAWQSVKPVKATSSSPTISLAVLDGGAVLASAPRTGRDQSTDYSVEFDLTATGLTELTGLAIEAMAHESLPAFGPGLSSNGNFVVTEVDLEWAPAAQPLQFTKQKLGDVQVDYIQKGFDAKLAIDGNPGNQQGWAVGGKEKQPHLARFRLAKPLRISAPGDRLRLKISCRYGAGEYPLGHFAINVTGASDALAHGLPAKILTILNLPPAQRSTDDQAQLEAYFRRNNPEWLNRYFAVAKEERPLPADPQMESLKAALATAEIPIRLDGQVVQLSQDFQQSAEQMKNVRLTAAQDLAWALINNPEFLFNH